MLRISLSAFLLTLSAVVLAGSFYVYPQTKKEEEKSFNYTSADSYKLDYYFDVQNFDFKVESNSTGTTQNFVITNKDGQSIKLDILRYEENKNKIALESFVSQQIDANNTQYSPGANCKYLVITVNVSKFYPFNNINNRQLTNPDVSMREAVEGFECRSQFVKGELNNLVI